MEFECWRDWSGPEVAFFLSVFCDLPQYEKALAQNLSGSKIAELHSARMLRKGLTRLGIGDHKHQIKFVSAVEMLLRERPEILAETFDRLLADRDEVHMDLSPSRRSDDGYALCSVTPAAPPKDDPFAKRPRRPITCSFDPFAAVTLRYAPAVKGAMQRQPCTSQFSSDARLTPRISNEGDQTVGLRLSLAKRFADYTQLANLDGPLGARPSQEPVIAIEVADARQQSGSKAALGRECKSMKLHYDTSKQKARVRPSSETSEEAGSVRIQGAVRGRLVGQSMRLRGIQKLREERQKNAEAVRLKQQQAEKQIPRPYWMKDSCLDHVLQSMDPKHLPSVEETKAATLIQAEFRRRHAEKDKSIRQAKAPMEGQESPATTGGGGARRLSRRRLSPPSVRRSSRQQSLRMAELKRTQAKLKAMTQTMGLPQERNEGSNQGGRPTTPADQQKA